jgi:hypothetical protein
MNLSMGFLNFGIVSHSALTKAAVLSLVMLALSCRSASETANAISDSISSKIEKEQFKVALPPPTLIEPNESVSYSSSKLTVIGDCKNGAQVYIARTDPDSSSKEMEVQNLNCVNSSFRVGINNITTDGTYTFNLFQKAPDGSVSESVTHRWIRDSSKPSAPLIQFPSSDPSRSAGNLSITGSCTENTTVQLSGDDTQSVHCQNSQFSILVSKSSDRAYQFQLKQRNLAGTDSDPINLTWDRDSQTPSTSITNQPEIATLVSNASFNFTSSESGGFQCKVDTEDYADCSSPSVFFNLASGPHLFLVRAVDLSNNIDPNPATFTWTQYTYNTIALYHFNSSIGVTTDSSNFSPSSQSPYYNGLIDSATTAVTNGQFAQSRNFSPSFSSYMRALHNPSHNLLTSQMTVEAFLKLNSNPGKNISFVIASKSDSSGQYGWEYGITHIGKDTMFYFAASQNGSTSLDVSRVYSDSFSPNASTHHVAVTWNQGSVKFYYDGDLIGARTLNFNTIFASSAALRLGANGGGSYLDGTLDEFRLSRVVRTISVPGAPYSPD